MLELESDLWEVLDVSLGSDFGNDCNRVEENKDDGTNLISYLRHINCCCPNTTAWRMKSQQRAKPETFDKDLNNHKISSFFTVARVVKAGFRSPRLEFFKPFYVKQDMELAPINHFQAGTSRKCIKSLHNKKASCINLRGEQRLLKLKLLQFHESLRPAFHGTLNITFDTKQMQEKSVW